MSGTLDPTVWVDISSTIAQKVAAVSCHESQVADPELADRVVSLRAGNEGRRIGVAYAEAFRRLTLHV
jgi:LmbE family N-acetylglucosaminyl deacetylase